MNLLETKLTPDFEGLRRCVLRQGKPERVYHIELFLDEEIKSAVADRFDLEKALDPSDPHYRLKRGIAIHRFLGYDTFRVFLPGFEFPLDWKKAQDTTRQESQARSERDWVDEQSGPIQSWQDFERYPWPDIQNLDTSPLEWLEKNLPDGMAVFDLTVHVFENLSWALGYESLCYKLYDEPELVEAVANKVGQLYLEHTRALCQFPCVGVIWGSDDLGFKSQTLLSPESLRNLVLPWHKKAATITHEAGKPYFLHACGNLDSLMNDLIDDVGIDAKHSFEDTILPVTEAKRRYGDRIGILGGIDMDFLCRASEKEIRRRVRQTLDVCQPGGGYCLGTGNTVANYIPLDNYLIMLDEGRRYGRT